MSGCPVCGAPYIGSPEDFERSRTRTLPVDATHVCAESSEPGLVNLYYHTPRQMSEAKI